MRLPLAVLRASVVCSLLVGCDAGTVVAPGFGSAGGGPGGGGAGMELIDFESEIQPLLEDRCGECHIDASVGPAFMAGPDMYETMMEWPDLVVPGEPGASTLITKGAHRGPAFAAAEARVVSEWIEQEGAEPVVGDGGMPLPGDDGGSDTPDAGTPTGDPPAVDGPYTPPMTVAAGVNEIDLTEAGLPGGVLTFDATRVASGIQLNDVEIRVGPSGAHIVHPLLIQWVDGRPTADPADSLGGVDVMIEPDTTEVLASSIRLEGFPDPGALSIQFESVGPL